MSERQSFLDTLVRDGAIDLSVLAINKFNPTVSLGNITCRTTTGLWYNLSPVEESAEHAATTIQPDNTIYPVQLEFDPWARMTGSVLEETKLGLWFMKKWVTERRHFKAGLVAVKNAVIAEGDVLTINGKDTGPIDVAWVTRWDEYVVSKDNGLNMDPLFDDDLPRARQSSPRPVFGYPIS